MSEENKPTKKLFAALAAGAAIGAATALLLSPRRGREIRAQLQESGVSLKERFQERRTRSTDKGASAAAPKSTLSHKAESSDYDVIVIGGGPSGLVAATYLAKAGRRVLLLEKRSLTGGTAVSEELIPGYQFSSLTDDSGCFSPEIKRDLELGRYGLQTVSFDPLIFSPLPDGTSLSIWQDVGRTVEEISRLSSADAANYPGFVERMSMYSQVISGLRMMTPPDLPDVGVRDILKMGDLAGSIRGLGGNRFIQAVRTLPMSVADLLNEWFESDVVKGLIAAPAVKDISLGPREAGTAYMLLNNWASSRGQIVPGAFAVGGSGALAQALKNSAAGNGVDIWTNKEVTKIITQDGQAAGVMLASGERLSAAVIVSAVDMRKTFENLVDPYYLDRSFVQHVSSIKYGGTMARMHFALNRLPAFTAAKGDNNLLAGRIQIAPSMTYLQKAYDPVKYGRWSQQPFLDVRIPSILDPSAAPAGQHLMSVTVKYMPYSLREGSWKEAGETTARLIMDTISEYAPDFSECVQEYRLITPLEIEATYGLPEASLSHGEMTLDRFMWMRPVPGFARYRAPINDLYLCSSATHPGGGITGLNGKNAAREILSDWS